MSPAELRQAIDDALAAGEAQAAFERLGELWHCAPNLATAGFVRSRFEGLRERLPIRPLRVAILRSFTVEPAATILAAAAAVRGLDLRLELGDFGAYGQEIFDGGSRIHRARPEVAILALQTRDVAPELWRGFADLEAATVGAVVDRVVADFSGWIAAFRERSDAHLVVHGLELPADPALGLFDDRGESGQARAIRRLNDELGALARRSRGVYLLDYDGLVARHGRLAWHDEAKWLAMRMPIAAAALPHLADEWLRFLHPLAGRSCKVLVTDLDNTLWGGVIGEDGLAGIQLGVEYPGAAYQGIQRALLDLHRRGILLAIASKNNPADALEALDRHPEMLLRREHFAALRLGWNDKASSLRELARELNLGLDAFAFLDDNPTERQWVRRQLPEVTVIDRPADVRGWARVVREQPVFERLALSTEDRDRAGYYAADRARDELQRGAASLDEFYRSLEMEAEVGEVDAQTLPRVAQLTQKTNQFNLTTRRYSEQEIARLAADPASRVRWLRVRDRFGDHGLVGVVIDRLVGEEAELDSFLLSCRVIGRTVETALLATVIESARGRGARRLAGWFHPTAKNAPAQDFYPQHGFVVVAQEGASRRFALELGAEVPTVPPWIRLLRRPAAER